MQETAFFTILHEFLLMLTMSSLIKRLESTMAHSKGEAVFPDSRDIEAIVRMLKNTDKQAHVTHSARSRPTSNTNSASTA